MWAPGKKGGKDREYYGGRRPASMSSQPERRIPASAILFLAANVLFGSGLFFHAFLYNFYLDKLGLSPTVMGRAAAALTTGGLLTLLPAGWIFDRLGARFSLLAGSFICAAGLAAGALTARPLPIYF